VTSGKIYLVIVDQVTGLHFNLEMLYGCLSCSEVKANGPAVHPCNKARVFTLQNGVVIILLWKYGTKFH